MHQPVLVKEVLECLKPQPGENFVDCTFGFGGHSLEILKRNKPDGKVLGIERDKKILDLIKDCPKNDVLVPRTSFFRTVLGNKRLIFANNNFKNLKQIVKKYEFNRINGILFDLGVSSWHFEQSGRGFTFQIDEPLVMNYKSGIKNQELTAQEIVNQWPEQELIRIFREYGEERHSRRIAQLICQSRRIKPIKTTKQLVEIIKKAVPKKYQYRRIHFATRVFQALRIAVNNELDNLESVLPQALEILEKNGRLVIISFHSLEDRLVKNFFRDSAKKGLLEILTKKPITPNQEEIRSNPRSRSAKLRAAVKI